MDKVQFVTELSKLRESATFLTLKGYRNEHSEVADYSIVFHMSHQNALKKSIMVLEGIVPDGTLQAQAKRELLESFQTSLQKTEETVIAEIEDAYTRFFYMNNYIRGVKMHTATGTLHLYGLVVHKKVIIPGTYPVKNKRELTLAKDKLRRLTPMGKFRQFKILPEQVDRIVVENISLLSPTE